MFHVRLVVKLMGRFKVPVTEISSHGGLTSTGTQFVTRSVSEGLRLFIFTENSLADASGY